VRVATNLLLRTIGLEPSHFNRRQKLHYLARLIPLAEANYNLVELGPRENSDQPDGRVV
jgi:ATP-dependent Lon protease